MNFSDNFEFENVNAPRETLDNIQFALSSAELDFLTIVEAGIRPPIAFRDAKILDQWISTNPLNIQKIGNRKTRNARVLIGKVNTPSGKRYYRQVWVRARYKDYRKAMVQYLRATDGDGVKVHRHDVDHAVASTYLLKQWPEAWVNVLFVSSGINRSVGSMMEKILKPVTEDQILLNAECVIKLLFQRKERLNRIYAKDYFAEASNRFLRDPKSNTQRLLDQISKELEVNFAVCPSGSNFDYP